MVPLSQPLINGLKMEHGSTPHQSGAFPGTLAIEQRNISLYYFFLEAAEYSLFLFLELGNRDNEREAMELTPERGLAENSNNHANGKTAFQCSL